MVNAKKILIGALFLPGLLQAVDVSLPECSETKPMVMVSSKNALFTVRLASNPTTGYRWFLKEAPGALIPLGVKFVMPQSTSRLVGVGGEEVWRFRATATTVPRQFKMGFIYARGFENEDVQKFSCQVSVLPAG